MAAAPWFRASCDTFASNNALHHGAAAASAAVSEA
jgi:hypothetical protein